MDAGTGGLSARAYWRALLLSWMPEQVDYLHDAAYWRALLGRCQGVQVREMESHEEFWADSVSYTHLTLPTTPYV